MRHRAAAWLLAIAAAAAVAPVVAQSAAGGPGADAAERSGNGSKVSGGGSRNGRNGGNGNGAGGSNGAPAYQDALIDGGRLDPDIWFGEVAEHDTGGLPRGLRVDGIYSIIERDNDTRRRYGIGVGAFLATPLHGSWSFDGVLAAGGDTDGSLVTLWQRDMPFDGGWRAANGLGHLNSPSIDLARFQPRWFLPTSPMLGGSTEWRDPTGRQVTAGVGEPGVYTGLYVPGFERLGGTLTTVGGQMAVTRNWTAGIQYLDANDVTSVLQPRDDGREFSTASWFASTAWQDATRRLQANVLSSRNSVDGSHQGGWADAFVQDGRYGHGFGAFYLGSNLAWGNQPVGSDSAGAYYRVNYASQRWLWDAMLDYAARLGDRGSGAVTFASGSTRYQVWRDLGVGAGGTARFDENSAWSAFAYVENTWPALVNRTQLYAAGNSPKSDLALTASQTWSVPAGTRLSTTLLLGRYDDGLGSSRRFGLAVFGGGDVTGDLSLDANFQWTHSTGDAQPTSLIGNLGFTWRLLPQLSLIGTVYRSQTRSSFPLQVNSPIDEIARRPEERINDRGALLILRYETRAGSMAAPLGGAPGSGAGRVTGMVFLDANDDARFAAGEAGVANVTVVLDGRYSTRTDGQGRFEFPAVAAGTHRITVLPDNLPLPWALADDGRFEFDLSVRGTVNVDIPAQRLR
jgi:hypothetical protein